MKTLAHKKFANPSILFELLCRQMTSDVMNNVESKAIPILKKYFAEETELSKELKLYNTLITEKFKTESKACSLVEAVVRSRSKLSKKKLKTEKYNLVKAINEHYDLKTFLSTPVQNYKILASIYKIFEYKEELNPTEIVNSKYTLVENIIQTSSTTKDEVTKNLYEQQDKDVRLLAYKLMIQKFNEKFSNSLNTKQKSLIKEYVYSISNNDNLKKYVDTEIGSIQKDLKAYNSKIKDTVVKIKLNEVHNLLNTVQKSKKVSDENVLSILRYYQLLDELKKVTA